MAFSRTFEKNVRCPKSTAARGPAPSKERLFVQREANEDLFGLKQTICFASLDIHLEFRQTFWPFGKTGSSKILKEQHRQHLLSPCTFEDALDIHFHLLRR